MKEVHPFFQSRKPREAKKQAAEAIAATLTVTEPKQKQIYKGECSAPFYISMTKPKFYSDTIEYQDQLKYQQTFNFYGKIPTTIKKPMEESDFSRLALFGYSHLTDKLFVNNHWHDQIKNIPIQLKIAQDPYGFYSYNKQLRKNRKVKPKEIKMKNAIHSLSELEVYLDAHFPNWQMYSSCISLAHSIFSKQTGQQPQQWTETYRPKNVNGLLGARYNHHYLKDWLHQMKIEPLSAPKKTKPKTNKKKKRLKLNHDLFDEDLKGLTLYETESDDEDFMLKPKKRKELKKTSMKSNIILLVGDHGVGKTASVYTVAEQLDYEVFEINSGSRRSGKDIMSMVGEMTKSHLVTFTKEEKKKKLNPCFSPSSQLPSQSNGLFKHFTRKPIVEQLKPSTKQSLILLEEVDLLFEEDKGFWSSVIELSQKSKRPIIMTCNDPDIIPTEELCIQAVLDIQPPHDNELLPYLWLVCFSEGFMVDPAELICLMALLGRDIRQLLQTLQLSLSDGNIFEEYLGIKSQIDLLELKSKSVASRVAIDTFRLARSFMNMNQDDTYEQEEDFDKVVEALENNSFIDAYCNIREKGNVIECKEDGLNGYTKLWLEQPEDIHLEDELIIFNSQLLKTNQWQTTILDEASHWQESCDTCLYHFEECSEAVEKLVPWTDEKTVMMDYIPYIKLMISNASTAKTRSKRKKIHLPLNEDSINVLNADKPIIDETELWLHRLELLKKES